MRALLLPLPGGIKALHCSWPTGLNICIHQVPRAVNRAGCTCHPALGVDPSQTFQVIPFVSSQIGGLGLRGEGETGLSTYAPGMAKNGWSWLQNH